MPATQKDIAQTLHISQQLVSYALTGKPGVGDAMRQRILSEAKKMGYVPNLMARALVTGRTSQIALGFPVLTSQFFRELTIQFQNKAHSSPYDLLIVNKKDAVHHPTTLTVDGAIFCGSIPPDLPTPYPVVEILFDLRGANAGEPPRQDVIIINLEKASREAVEHLLEQGKTRIAFVSIPNMMNSFQPRYRGYSLAMRKAKLPLETISFESPGDEHHRDYACAALQQYFCANGFPEALFCSNDDIAIGAYRALRQLERTIPNQTAVIGCHDYTESKDHIPALSSIRLPIEDICGCAWKMLADRIENPALPPQEKVFKSSLVIRQSSLCAPEVIFTSSKPTKVLLLDDS